MEMRHLIRPVAPLLATSIISLSSPLQDEIARRILIEKQREMLLRDREATIRMSREQARKQVAESKEPSSPADDAESKGEPDLESGVAKVDPSSSGGAAAAAGGGSS